MLLQLLLRLKGVITLPIITYLLSPEELGIFNLIQNTACLLVPFFTLNLTDGPVIYFVREKAKENLARMYSTVLNMTFLTSLLGLGVLFLLLRVSTSLDDIRPYFLWCCLAYLSLHVFKVTSYILVVYQKTARMVRYSAWNEMSGVLLGILFVWMGWSYRGLIFGNFLAGVTVGVLILRLLLKEIRYVPRVDTAYLAQFFRMSIPLMPVFLFSWIMQSLDTYFLAYYWSPDTVGQYAVLYSICRLILATSMALNFFWYPISVKLWAEARETYVRYLRLLVSHGLFLLLLLLLLFESNSRLLLLLFARRPEYQAASPYLSLVAFAFVMQVLITLLMAPLYANENPRWIFLSNLAGGLLNLVLNILLIPRWSLLGASISTALAYLLVVLFLGIGIRRLCRISVVERRTIVLVGFGFLSWIPLVVLRSRLDWLTGLLCSLVLGTCFLLLYYVFFLTHEEKRQFNVWVRKIADRLNRSPHSTT